MNGIAVGDRVRFHQGRKTLEGIVIGIEGEQLKIRYRATNNRHLEKTATRRQMLVEKLPPHVPPVLCAGERVEVHGVGIVQAGPPYTVHFSPADAEIGPCTDL